MIVFFTIVDMRDMIILPFQDPTFSFVQQQTNKLAHYPAYMLQGTKRLSFLDAI